MDDYRSNPDSNDMRRRVQRDDATQRRATQQRVQRTSASEERARRANVPRERVYASEEQARRAAAQERLAARQQRQQRSERAATQQRYAQRTARQTTRTATADRTTRAAAVDTRYRPYRTQQKAAIPPWLIIAAIVVVALIAGGIWWAVSHSGSAEGNAQTSLSASDKDASKSDRDAAKGITETTDANGVVHGTTADGVNYLVFGAGQPSTDGNTISFAAVGDVFATSMNFGILDSYAGEMGDGLYEFLPYYQGTASTIQQYDLRFVNQETPCAGDEDGYSYSGYPVFNTPDSSITAIAAVGFNVVNYNSNHSWDQGSFGIERTQSLFAQYPQIALIGTYASQEDRETLRLVERNGSRIAFLSYCFMDNFYGTDPAEFPNTYYSCPFDKDAMSAEIERAKKIADAVVVYVHWGTEYTTEPDDYQLEYAQFLADLDVDLIVGSHAHILQPIRYYIGPSGKQIPVVFGLSDFITGWTLTDTILSGMFTCDFTRDGDKLVVGNCAFHPAIEWQSEDGGDTYVRFLEDMSEYEIATNLRTEDVGDDVSYLRTFIDDLHMEVPVTW